jgi:hypothetical protein
LFLFYIEDIKNYFRFINVLHMLFIVVEKIHNAGFVTHDRRIGHSFDRPYEINFSVADVSSK